MSKDKTKIYTGGIRFIGLLTIVFITLKLTGYIAWSWLWVLSPLWLPITVVSIVAVLGFIIMFAWVYITEK